MGVLVGKKAPDFTAAAVLASGEIVDGYNFAAATKGNYTALRMLAAGKLGDDLFPININTNYTGPGGPMVFDNSGDVVYG